MTEHSLVLMPQLLDRQQEWQCHVKERQEAHTSSSADATTASECKWMCYQRVRYQIKGLWQGTAQVGYKDPQPGVWTWI